MHLRAEIAAFVAVLTVSTATLAQTPSRVLGLTRTVPYLASFDVANCSPSFCNPALAPAPAPYAGGTAHDPRDRATWISNGIDLMKVDPRNGCNVACPSLPAPGITAGSLVTGLAFNEYTQRLFISYSDNRIVSFLAVGCTLTPLTQCFVTVPPNHVVSGLATDDSTGRLFYGTAPWLGASSTPYAEVHVASQTSPCTSTCSFPVPGCLGTVLFELTGLGYDACSDELHVSDSFRIVTLTGAGTCAPNQTNCCPAVASLGDELGGLCVLPSTEVSVGAPCFAGTSPVCASMEHVLGGDPTIGNLGFSLDLVDAPAGSLAFALIDLGACASPGWGSFCQPLSPTTLAGSAVATGTGCGGFASVPFPLPNIPILCGIVLHSQYVGQVPPGWSGHYVSNCVTWMISAS